MVNNFVLTGGQWRGKIFTKANLYDGKKETKAEIRLLD